MTIAYQQYTGDTPLSIKQRSRSPIAPKANIKKIYPLGDAYPGVCFMEREMEISFFLLMGFTYKKMAKILNLSDRTIEFYAHQMKLKLHCPHRRALIQRLGTMEVIQEYVLSRVGDS
ncbi:MAG: hypothetical protein A3F41_01475 [Coxiella sp. RIFCSPHIGHO2_12_FULL_44_14]|nr:MAG: hypothetical protein A3F41_01475 [Coxiella sp. RIFCSPHIGHO2_12_FULL_44_14]